jgi:hypothetical protein
MDGRTYCYGCGEDCTHAYGTHNGYPYHFGCIPMKKKPRPVRNEQVAEPLRSLVNDFSAKIAEEDAREEELANGQFGVGA